MSSSRGRVLAHAGGLAPWTPSVERSVASLPPVVRRRRRLRNHHQAPAPMPMDILGQSIPTIASLFGLTLHGLCDGPGPSPSASPSVRPLFPSLLHTNRTSGALPPPPPRPRRRRPGRCWATSGDPPTEYSLPTSPSTRKSDSFSLFLC